MPNTPRIKGHPMYILSVFEGYLIHLIHTSCFESVDVIEKSQGIAIPV